MDDSIIIKLIKSLDDYKRCPHLWTQTLQRFSGNVFCGRQSALRRGACGETTTPVYGLYYLLVNGGIPYRGTQRWQHRGYRCVAFLS